MAVRFWGERRRFGFSVLSCHARPLNGAPALCHASHQDRHCEPTGPAQKAGPMTGSAKQSRGPPEGLDRFVAALLVMTAVLTIAIPG
jgi:hypothetical protein